MRGKALAGVMAFATLALAGCGSSSATDIREDVARDVLDLWEAIATYYVDNTDDPTVTYSDGKYYVDGEAIEARAKEPVLTFEGNGPESWCVTISYNGGKAAVSEGSNWELLDKAGC